MTIGSSSKNIAGSTQGGCLVEYLGRVFSFGTGKVRELAPVLGLHLPVELAQRIDLNLAQRGLDGRVILGGVIHEDARHRHGEVGGRAHHAGNAGRGCAFPVRPHDHVETGLGAVLQPELADLVRARVVHRERPETIAKVGHLQDHRLLRERQIAQPVHDILVRDRDEGLARIDVTGQHSHLIHRADRHHAGEETGFGNLRELRPLVVDIDERPPPDVGHAAHHLHIRLCHRTGVWAPELPRRSAESGLAALEGFRRASRERCRSRRR